MVAGCAPDDEDAGLILPLLTDRPRRDGRANAYVCESYPVRTRRPTRRGWRGSPAFRRDRQMGRRPSILPGTCKPENGNVGKGSARNRLQVPESRIPQEMSAVNRLLTVDIRTGRMSAIAREAMNQLEVAQGEHDRVRLLPALAQASRRRGMTSCRRSRASSPCWVSRPQNRRILVSTAYHPDQDLRRSVPPYSRDRKLP